MKISTKGRYGLRMIIELAKNYNRRVISIKEIAEKNNISEKYLEQIIILFNKAGLVTSFRGAGGGYRLNFPPEKLMVGTVLRTVEGSLSPVDCVDFPDHCPRSGQCITIALWKRLKEAIDGVVDHTSIADLIDEKGENDCTEYYI